MWILWRCDIKKRLGRITAAVVMAAVLCIALTACMGPIGRNQEPVANFTTELGDEAFSIIFDGDSSLDLDGEIVLWKWWFGDGEKGNGVTVTHEYAGPGTYPVCLRVEDNDGARDKIMKDVTVAPDPTDPTVGVPFASFSCPKKVQTGSVVSFDARESFDSEGWIILGMWDFGDGQPDSLAVGPWTEIIWDEDGVMEEVSVMREVEHIYLSSGRYTITLTIADNDMKYASTSRTIRVSYPPAPPS